MDAHGRIVLANRSAQRDARLHAGTPHPAGPTTEHQLDLPLGGRQPRPPDTLPAAVALRTGVAVHDELVGVRDPRRRDLVAAGQLGAAHRDDGTVLGRRQLVHRHHHPPRTGGGTPGARRAAARCPGAHRAGLVGARPADRPARVVRRDVPRWSGWSRRTSRPRDEEYLALIHPDDRPAAGLAAAAGFSTGHREVFRVVRPDGDDRGTCRPGPTSSGTPRGRGQGGRRHHRRHRARAAARRRGARAGPAWRPRSS